MNAELSRLESKLVELIDSYRELCAENAQLRDELAQLQQDKQALKQNMLVASSQLEQLLHTLPEEEA